MTRPSFNPSKAMALLALTLGALLALILVIWMLAFAPWDRFASEGRWLFEHVWGQIALLDLYAGFFLALALVWRLESQWWARLLVTVTLPLLGNPVLAIWMLWRWRQLLAIASFR